MADGENVDWFELIWKQSQKLLSSILINSLSTNKINENMMVQI